MSENIKNDVIGHLEEENMLEIDNKRTVNLPFLPEIEDSLG